MISLYKDRYRTPTGAEVQYDIIEHPGAVMIVPLFVNNDVLLVEQYRAGANRSMLEFPAGCIDAGEDPLACASRELKEETGYKAGKLELISSLYASPGFLSEQAHIFLATELEADGEQALDEHEHINVHRMSLTDLKVQMRSGNIKDARTFACLGWLFTFKPSVLK